MTQLGEARAVQFYEFENQQDPSKKVAKKMKISIFFILTIYIQNAKAEGPKTPTSLWDLAITKSHHSAPEPKSERPKFPRNFLPIPPPTISYSEDHDDTLAKPTVILGKKMVHVIAYQ